MNYKEEDLDIENKIVLIKDLECPSKNSQMRYDAITVMTLNCFIPLINSLFPSPKLVGFSIAFSVLMLMLTGKHKRSLKAIIGLCIFFGLYYLNTVYLNSSFLGTFFRMMLLFIPCVFFAMILIGDYNASHILSALQRLRIPKIITIGITVALRYIPTFYMEFKIIRNALKIRGVDASLKHPIRSFEYIFVPQLFRCLSISGELTAAGITKGISSPAVRTDYFAQGLKFIDYFVFVIFFGGTALIVGGVT